MDINNIEYKPGLSSYGAPGLQGADGSSGNTFFYTYESSVTSEMTKEMTIKDSILNRRGMIYNKSKQSYGSILNKELNLDNYYIDKHSSDGSIIFNIDKSECIISEGIHYELRNKYTNEIKTIKGYYNE